MGNRGRETVGSKVNSSPTPEDDKLKEQQKSTERSHTYTLSDRLIRAPVKGKVGLYFRSTLSRNLERCTMTFFPSSLDTVPRFPVALLL